MLQRGKKPTRSRESRNAMKSSGSHDVHNARNAKKASGSLDTQESLKKSKPKKDSGRNIGNKNWVG